MLLLTTKVSEVHLRGSDRCNLAIAKAQKCCAHRRAAVVVAAANGGHGLAQQYRREQREPTEPLQHLISAAGALVVSVATLGGVWVLPPAANANIVRLADVESSELRAGLEAAITGEYTKAELIFSRMLFEDPSLASVWSNLGNVHMSQGRAKQALDDYTYAVQLAPDAPVPYLNRAIALEELGVQLEQEGRPGEARERWREGLADCDSAIARDARESAAWFNKGNLELRLQDYLAALSCFSAAADLSPGIPGYRLRAAQLRYQVGDVEGAVRAVKGVLRKSPSYAEAHTSLAAMLWSQGQVAGAEGQLEAALELGGGRWRDAEWVAGNTRWPPALVDALQRLLVMDLRPGSDSRSSARSGLGVPVPLAVAIAVAAQ